MAHRRNPEKEKKEKMVLLSGVVMILVTALVGTQMLVEGRVYKEKMDYLDRKGYMLNNTLSWDGYESWKHTEVSDKLKGEYEMKVVQCGSWQDFKDFLNQAKNAPIYDDSLWGSVYHDNQTYTIWFHAVNSRKTSGLATVTTYFVMPDLVPENNED